MNLLKNKTYVSIAALFVTIAFAAAAGEINTQISTESPVVELFKDLTKSTNWHLVIPISFLLMNI